MAGPVQSPGLGIIEDILVAPDTSAEHDYLKTFKSTYPLEPEKSLMLAVLEEAMSCLEKYFFSNSKEERMLFNEARDWILSDDDGWIHSFSQICFHLGYDDEYLRRGFVKKFNLNTSTATS